MALRYLAKRQAVQICINYTYGCAIKGLGINFYIPIRYSSILTLSCRLSLIIFAWRISPRKRATPVGNLSIGDPGLQEYQIKLQVKLDRAEHRAENRSRSVTTTASIIPVANHH